MAGNKVTSGLSLRNNGLSSSGTLCGNMTESEILSCIAKKILESNSGNFNILTNNCRDHSDKILNECCAERNDLINNPDNSNSITRGIADAIIAPFIYIPMFF